MATALKEFTLYGSRYQHGSPIPDAVWESCDKRQRVVLERNRFITHTPVAQPDRAPRVSNTPRTADGATSRRRGRKAG